MLLEHYASETLCPRNTMPPEHYALGALSARNTVPSERQITHHRAEPYSVEREMQLVPTEF